MALFSFKHSTLLCLLINILLLELCFAANIVSDSWIQVATPLGAPSARESHSAIFNAVNKTMILFGGKNGNKAFNDISKFTVDQANEWTINVKTTGTPPSPRYGHSAIVTALNTMIIFGGRNTTTLYNEVYSYDLIKDSWSTITTTNTPSPRAYHTAVYDAYNHCMYVYGGEADSDFYDEMYKLNFDTNEWSEVIPVTGSAQKRAYHSAILTGLGVMVVFGGKGGLSSTGYADVSCYNFRNQSWTNCLRDTTPAPSVRYAHTAVCSPLQQMVVFGGRNSGGNPVNDIWNFDLSTFTWSVVVPGGLPIDARAFHTSVASTFGSMIIFGGIDSDGDTNDDFGLYNLASTILRTANDGAVMVVLITLLGTIMISMCFAIDYMHEQSEIEKEEAIAKAKSEQLLLPKLPAIPKALHIPLGPRAQKFFDEFKTSLDPMKDPL